MSRLFIAALFLSLWHQSAVDRGLSVKPGPGRLVLGKQCRPRSDAAQRGVWSGSALFTLLTGSLGLYETVLSPFLGHFPSLHSESIDPPVLSALWFLFFVGCNTCDIHHNFFFLFFFLFYSSSLCHWLQCSVSEALPGIFTTPTVEPQWIEHLLDHESLF